jgi:hypothetical protein
MLKAWKQPDVSRWDRLRRWVMKEQKIQSYDLHCQPLCQVCHNETRTMHIYLTSGGYIKIGNADKLRVEGDTLVVDCIGEGVGHALQFRRKDVYFATCEDCMPPPFS